MATFTYPDDQKRLQRIFNLDRTSLAECSILRRLMETVEELDEEDSFDRVTDILAYMAEIDTASTGLNAQMASVSGEVKSLSVSGEYSVKYASGGKTLKPVTQTIVAKQNILRLLDPEGRLIYDRFHDCPDPDRMRYHGYNLY